MVVCPACNSRYDEGITFCPRDGTHVVNDNSGSEVGKVLADRYKIVRKLGEGGMGEVYEAHHVYIEKKFALKLLRQEIMSNQEAVTRFHQEARSASAIGHENIVEIDDFGRLPDGRAYLAMEYLEGVSLAEAAKEPLTIPRAIEVMRQVCVGLHAAHEKNIIHRDMKPENVFLVKRQGRELAKILDFGIAKVSGADSTNPHLTRTGTIFGTPHYMSPEQALGKLLDKRTDVYSVGVIMYEIFTGAVPFRGDSFMAILTQHITTAPARPRDVAPERNIPPEVENIILRAMAKDPAERFSSMNELGQALAALLPKPATGSYTPAQSSGYMPTMVAPEGVMRGTPVYGTPAQPGSRPPGTQPGSRPPATMSAGGAPQVVPRTVAPQPQLPDPPIIDANPPARKSHAALWVGMGLLLMGAGGGGGYYYYTHFMAVAPAPTPVPAPVPDPGQAKKDPEPPPQKQPEPPPAPQAAKTTFVLVDSVPRGASILRDGQRIDETPANIEIPDDGSKIAIELHRDGSRDFEGQIDGSQKKWLFKLERARKGEEHHHAQMPAPPVVNKPVPQPVVRREPPPEPQPVVHDPPPQVQPQPEPVPVGGQLPPVYGQRPNRPIVVAPPPLIRPPNRPPRKGKKNDPYERLDKPDKPEEPLDPYK